MNNNTLENGLQLKSNILGITTITLKKSSGG